MAGKKKSKKTVSGLPRARASIDAGNGVVNAVLNNIMIYFASVRAAVTGASLNLQGSALGQMNIPYSDWNGRRYTWGDSVLHLHKPTQERHMGDSRYANELHQYLVAVALGQLGIGDGVPVDLTLCVPPGYYNAYAEYMVKRFTDEFTIHFSGEEKPRTWNIESVRVWPESLAMGGFFMLNAEGEPVETDLFDGETVLLDVGINTLDAVRVSSGNFNPESLETATWADGGANEHVRKPLLALLKHQGDDFANATVDHIDAAFRQDKPIISMGGAKADLTTALDEYAGTYAAWIANNVISGEYRELRSVRNLIVGGGLAKYIRPHLVKWYKEKVFDPSKHPVASKVHPGFWNAIGARNLTAMELASVEA